jgi:hypothetical protein
MTFVTPGIVDAAAGAIQAADGLARAKAVAQARHVQSARLAGDAAGIAAKVENKRTEDREGDGRRLWELANRDAADRDEADLNAMVSPEDVQAEETPRLIGDATGPSGTHVDFVA